MSERVKITMLMSPLYVVAGLTALALIVRGVLRACA